MFLHKHEPLPRSAGWLLIQFEQQTGAVLGQRLHGAAERREEQRSTPQPGWRLMTAVILDSRGKQEHERKKNFFLGNNVSEEVTQNGLKYEHFYTIPIVKTSIFLTPTEAKPQCRRPKYERCHQELSPPGFSRNFREIYTHGPSQSTRSFTLRSKMSYNVTHLE